MPPETPAGSSSAKSFIEAINQSYAHLMRTLIFFLLVFTFLVVAMVLFFRSLTGEANFKAEFNNDGRLILEMKKSSLFSEDDTQTFASFLLPSNQVWFDTGLELDENQECNFKISGTAHLAINSVVKCSDTDTRNPIPWTTLKGNEWANTSELTEQKNAKKQLLLKPGETIGNIVGYYSPVDDTKQFKQYFALNRKELTTKIFEVNNEKAVPNTTKGKVRIYLSVNDILLSFDSAYLKTSEMAYTGNIAKWKPNWQKIKSEKYDNLYFDDNIGNFLVQVEIKKIQKH